MLQSRHVILVDWMYWICKKDSDGGGLTSRGTRQYYDHFFRFRHVVWLKNESVYRRAHTCALLACISSFVRLVIGTPFYHTK